MDANISLESILHMLSSLSLNNRRWLAEHLLHSEESEHIQERTSDEEFLSELRSLRYEGEPSTEEKKKILRDSHFFGGRQIKYDNEG